jgi:hypothetical protein
MEDSDDDDDDDDDEATQRVMAAKLTRPTHKIAIQLHLVAEICTICTSRSRRLVRKLFWIHPLISYTVGNVEHSLDIKNHSL